MTQRKRFETYHLSKHPHIARWLGAPVGYADESTQQTFELWQAAEKAALPTGYTAVKNTALAWLFGETDFKKPDNAFGMYWWRKTFKEKM